MEAEDECSKNWRFYDDVTYERSDGSLTVGDTFHTYFHPFTITELC